MILSVYVENTYGLSGTHILSSTVVIVSLSDILDKSAVFPLIRYLPVSILFSRFSIYPSVKSKLCWSELTFSSSAELMLSKTSPFLSVKLTDMGDFSDDIA